MIDTVKNMPDVKIKLVNKGNIEETTSRTISNGKKIIPPSKYRSGTKNEVTSQIILPKNAINFIS